MHPSLLGGFALASLFGVIPNRSNILTFLKVKCSDCDIILRVPLEGLLLTGVLDRTQLCVWDTEVSPASYPLIW